MPTITERLSYNGFDAKVKRLGLASLLAEVESAVTGFPLRVEEQKQANGTRQIREAIDQGFSNIEGWTKIRVGGIDWRKSDEHGQIGVEVQVSGRSDMLAVDLLHLRAELNAGNVDVGVIVVPDDTLSYYLTDRTPNLRTALRHMHEDATDAIQLIAFRHDGPGPPIPKARTNLGR